MEFLPYIIIAIIGLVSGVFSGITGGGGALIMIPAFIFGGLPPQMAVATAKLSGIGGDFGGLQAFVKSGHIRKDIIKVMIPIAVIVAIAVPVVFDAITTQVFQIALAIFMILMLPTLFVKNKPIKRPTQKHRLIGYSLYTAVLFLQEIFSGGVGSLAIYVLIHLFGASNIETLATRRAIVAVLSPITVIALLIGGYINIGLGLTGLVSQYIGAHIGTRILLKRGEQFISIMMTIAILISSSALLYNGLTAY